MAPGDVDQVVTWVMEKLSTILNQVKLVVSRADFGSIMTAITLIVSVVEQAAEQFDGLDGPAKKEVAKRVLNNLIDIPFIPEYVEGWMFGMLIDWVVDALNAEGWTALEHVQKQAETETA